MENAIYNELLRRGYDVDVGVVPIPTRDKNGKQSVRQHEIDFVVNRGNGAPDGGIVASGTMR